MSVSERNPKVTALVIDLFMLMNAVPASSFHLKRKRGDFGLRFSNSAFNGLKIVAIFWNILSTKVDRSSNCLKLKRGPSSRVCLPWIYYY